MADRQRLDPQKQTLDDAYAAPANFLEVDVVSPETHGVGKKRYTDYEVRMRVRNCFMEFEHYKLYFRHFVYYSGYCVL